MLQGVPKYVTRMIRLHVALCSRSLARKTFDTNIRNSVSVSVDYAEI